MRTSKYTSSTTDVTSNTTLTNISLEDIHHDKPQSNLEHQPFDQLSENQIFSLFKRGRASVLNKYHYYFQPPSFSKSDWLTIQSIHDSYANVLKVPDIDSPIIKDDLNNLLSENNLKHLHKQMTMSLIDPINHLEIGVDDFELTFNLTIEQIEKTFNRLKSTDEIRKKRHRRNNDLAKRYDNAVEFHFATGGIFSFHHLKQNGDCLVSFRLTETPWANIQTFFVCLYKAIGKDEYQLLVDKAKVTRIDPYFLIHGIPLPMLLVDSIATNNGKPLKKKVFREQGRSVHGSVYLGKYKSSHFVIYCVLSKLNDIINKKVKSKKKVGALYSRLFNRIGKKFFTTKVERNINNHQQGGGLNYSVSQMHKLKGHTFNKLKFYSPKLLGNLSLTIVKKLFKHGFINVRQELTAKQLKSFDTAFKDSTLHLDFDYHPVVDAIEEKLSILKDIIVNPID